jgi:hypothetical protein
MPSDPTERYPHPDCTSDEADRPWRVLSITQMGEAGRRAGGGQVAVGAFAELVDDACDVHAGYVGRWPVRQLSGSSSGPESDVGGVHRHRVHCDPLVAGAGLGFG